MRRHQWVRHRPLFAPPPLAPKQGLGERVLPYIWRIIQRVCYFVGAMVLISLLFMFIGLSNLGGGPAAPSALPREMVLYLQLDDEPAEKPRSTLFAEPQETIHGLVDTIDHAAADARVKGIFVRMNQGSFALTHAAELRDAIKRFRAAKKFAYVYSTSYGQGSGDMGRYYLASAFDEIWMQPMGIVSINGVRAEVPFLRKTLDMIGITPQMFKRKEYKTAYESFTNNEMSEPNREELTAILGDMKDAIMKDVPNDRGMTPKAFADLVDEGLFTAPEALKAKLITHSNYADVLVERIKKDVAGDAEADDSLFVDTSQYAAATWHEKGERGMIAKALGSRPVVALIYVLGPIVDSNSGGDMAAADEIAPAILAAADDENIQAIILRVDSPGGSAIASESILRAVERAKRKGKPVIVSMGQTAASGGYWVAAYADQIFAMPTTLTGSIGVLGGKVSAGKLSNKLGVTWDNSVKWGKNSGFWSFTTPFSESEAKSINEMLDHVYISFVERVAKGRGMTVAEVDKIAGGRVWSGSAAAKNGLVDQLGGLREAMNYTAKILDAKDRDGIDVIILPAPKTTFDQLMEFVDSQSLVFAQNLQFQQRINAFLAPVSEAAAVYQSSNGTATYEPMKLDN